MSFHQWSMLAPLLLTGSLGPVNDTNCTDSEATNVPYLDKTRHLGVSVIAILCPSCPRSGLFIDIIFSE
ncbi:MAG: hypothetical protein OEL56_07375 [Nitrosopumilus sp.]|nr:hypothetical protein [Nitrosopumilus sp.]MDH3516993.1 hypothetical protein [Nitrosopumilus sp.]MDH3565691.1 hypothetical protein [Nitrosopumilus sp.]MDH5416549.1 hypothetical protein [Nitrosopumilus sp.]MDH5555149.1 hypothetical protein [Nitrosopumilus sp.]